MKITQKNQKIDELIYEKPVHKGLIHLSLPVFFGMFFTTLYTVIDMIWISYIDKSDPSYLGGTGLIFPVIFIAIAFANGLTVGVSSLVARAFGEKNYEILKKVAESGLFAAFMISVVLWGGGMIFIKNILNFLIGSNSGLLSAAGNAVDYRLHAREYFANVLPAVFPIFLGHILIGILRGEGQMRYVMNGMILGTFLNIVFDPVFIFILDLKIQGAALATVFSQTIGMGYILSVFLRNKVRVNIEWKLKYIDKKVIKEIFIVGLPQSAAQILMSFSFMILNRLIISINPKGLTAFSLCGRIQQVMFVPIFALSAGVTTMVGQNVGRGLFHRVKRITLSSFGLAAIFIAIMGSVLFIYAPAIVPLLQNDPEVIKYAVFQIRLTVFSFMAAVIGIQGRAVFQAAGYPLPGLILTLLRTMILVVPSAWILSKVFEMGFRGVILGLVTGNLLTGIIAFIWIYLFINRLKQGKIKPRTTKV